MSKEKFVFPQGEDVGEVYSATNGLTKREYFAAMAMQAMISSTDYMEGVTRRVIPNTIVADILANDAIVMANTLLKKLGENNG